MSPKKLSLQETHPKVAGQWHPTENGKLTPDDVVAGSHQKVWWKCDEGSEHQWESPIKMLVRSYQTGNSGYPYCRGFRVSGVDENSLNDQLLFEFD